MTPSSSTGSVRSRPDACPVVAYGALIPQVALDIPRHGWVNLHFSLLPAWRGAAPVQHAVMAGDEVTGASTFLIEAGLDTGPVFGVMTERIRPRDTAGDLLGRLAEGGAGLLRRHHGRPRRRLPDAGAAGARRGLARAEDRGRRRAGALGPSGRRPWTGRCAGAPRRRARGRPSVASASSSLPVHLDDGYAGSPLAPGELAAGKREVHVGTASGVGAALGRAAARQEGDGRGRLGAWRPDRRGRAVQP